MAVLIPDEKSLVLLIKKIFWLVQDAAGYHPGPVAPPRTDGASLGNYFYNNRATKLWCTGGGSRTRLLLQDDTKVFLDPLEQLHHLETKKQKLVGLFDVFINDVQPCVRQIGIGVRTTPRTMVEQ